MSRYDVGAEQRRIEVARARPARVVVVDPDPELPTDLHLVLCGYCGIRLTVYDHPSRLISLEGWTIEGWNWTPRRTRQVRQRQSSVALATGSWLRGDHRYVAFFPVIAANGWQRPDLPAILICYSCDRQNALTPSHLATKISS